MKKTRSEVYDNTQVIENIHIMEDAGWQVYLVTPYGTGETIVTYIREA